MNIAEALKSEIEKKAAELGLAPSTVGRMVGQGGRFYTRLQEGKRVWPETADDVRLKLAKLTTPSLPHAQEANQ